MAYFDLHCHPTFKYTLLSAQAQQATSVDEPVQIRFKGLLDRLKGIILWTLGDPIDSQSSLTQLFGGQAGLISHTIYALENAYTKSAIITQLQCVSDTLNMAKIQQIRQGTVGYRSLVQEQLDLLASLSTAPHRLSDGIHQIRLINDFSEYKPNDLTTLYVILNFEGGHCFYSGQANEGNGFDEDVLANLVNLKKSGLRPLYVTLVHHAQNALANHAFGVPTQWAGAGTNDSNIGGYTPTGAGITPLGQQFIDEALSTQHGPPIYIDVKHMSLGSRMDFYEQRRQRHPHSPIIASHMGVTGLSWHDTVYNGQPVVRWVHRQAEFVEVKYNDLISFPRDLPVPSPTDPILAPTSVVTFNPWSINLYDEDIQEILAADGLIGLSLDVRILGMGNDRGVAYEHEPERLSLNEQLFSVQQHQATGENDDDHLPNPFIQSSLEHAEYLCNNLLHIVRVGQAVLGDRVWDHICLGSDLDGLIVPIEYRNNHRTNADNIPALRDKLKQTLPVVAQKLGMTLVAPHQPLDPFLDSVLNKFFLDNAVRFLKTYFSRPLPTGVS